MNDMNDTKFVVTGEICRFDKYFKVDSATVSVFENGECTDTYERFRLTRPNASAVLVFNEDTKKVILVKQFRYPISHFSSENILEVAAGKVDPGENPRQTAVREVFEEIGYRITEDRLSNPIVMLTAPGYSTEKIFIYLSIVNNSDKVPESGGGLASEHEKIEIVEIDVNDFKKMISDNIIQDAKTVIAANLIKI